MTILGITCQRDDGPYLGEWLAHHLAAGFDHMLVLSHDCSDGSDAHLNALAKDPRITYLPFEPAGKKSVQWQALKHVADHPLYNNATWALFFDCDEYLCLPDATLPNVLTDLERARGSFDAWCLPWRLFGSSGLRHRAEGLTPSIYLQAAPRDLNFPLGHLFKTLHRPGAFQKPGVHRPRIKKAKSTAWLGPDGAPLPEQFAASDKAISLYGQYHGAQIAYLNHYSLRSTEEFLIKRARGLPNHEDREIGVTYWAERNWNTDASRDIQPMLAATHDTLDALMTLQDVRTTYEACLAWHKAKYAALCEDIETLRLEFRLNLLTGSTPPSEQEGRRFMAAQSRLLTRKARA